MKGLSAILEQYSSCPICGSAAMLWRNKSTHDIERCSNCGYAFVNPRPSMAFLMEYYAARGHKLGSGSDASTFQDICDREIEDPASSVDAAVMIDTISSLLRPTTPRTLFDVGCGYGLFAAEAQRKGFTVSCIELAENERQIAAQALGVVPMAVSFEDYPVTDAPDFYGALLFSQILEHARDVNLWISKAHQLLKPGGILAIALPNFGSLFRLVLQERDPFVTPPEHLNYFSASNLSILLRKHGFEVERAQWYSHIHKRAIDRRLPQPLKGLAPMIRGTSHMMLSAIDYLKMGMMVRIYARRQD